MPYTDFACVRYEDGDKLGKLLAYASLLPLVLILHEASTFYSRRCGAATLALHGVACGCMLAAAISMVSTIPMLATLAGTCTK